MSTELHDKHVLVVTAGLKSKRSFLALAFEDVCKADIIYGKVARERRIDRILHWVGLGQIAANERAVNNAILEKSSTHKYDFLCVIKGLTVRKSTLEAVKVISPDTKLVCWTCDDLALLHNQSPCFVNAAPAYDVIFTAKSNNIKFGELSDLGFKQVEFFYQAYSTHDHFPLRDETSSFQDRVLFIGFAENKRFQYMNYLAENGITVDVYGSGWNRAVYEKNRHENLILHKRPLLGRDYAAAISNAAINLCFLRALNRDLHTSRTFEIPACGGFMLAERTEEHQHLFKEGEEVEFFDSKDEILQKVRVYLKQSYKRMQIAESGYARTMKENYSYQDMARAMIAKVVRNDG